MKQPHFSLTLHSNQHKFAQGPVNELVPRKACCCWSMQSMDTYRSCPAVQVTPADRASLSRLGSQHLFSNLKAWRCLLLSSLQRLFCSRHDTEPCGCCGAFKGTCLLAS